MFLRRLEIYTEVPPTIGMIDINVKIMVEVLSILGIATKEIKESQLSKYFSYKYDIFMTEGRSEKYAKKLVGRTKIVADALQRLDKLTQDEARMAATQNLKVTHNVDERVKGVAITVETIDNKVTSVDERVACLDDRVASVNEGVVAVGDRVEVVDTKLMQVISGTLNKFN